MSTHAVYEPHLSDLGTFDSRDAALDYVAALLAVNTDDAEALLDELTVASDCGHKLAGNALRMALEARTQAVQEPW